MRTVLYTNDLIPITVIDLPPFAQEHLRKERRVRLAVIEPLRMLTGSFANDRNVMILEHVVEIEAEILRRDGAEAMFLFTGDEESALLLKSAFLPGQTSTVREAQRAAFANGFMDAVLRLGL